MKILIISILSILILTSCASKESIQQISADSGYSEARLIKIETLISNSDDYKKHRSFFLIKTIQLLDQGRITESGLEEWGGWWRSQSYKGKYFTYKNKDSVSVADKVYIDPSNP